MISLDRLFTWIFRSFRPEGDIHMLEHLRTIGIKRAVIIRRSWLFGLFHVWILILIFVLFCLNFLITKTLYIVPLYETLHQTLLIISFFFLIVSYKYYLFRVIQGEKYLRKCWEIGALIRIIQHQKGAFRLLFNITFLGEIVLGILFIVSIFTSKEGGIGFLSVSETLLGAGLLLLMFFRKKMLDLELDYTIVTKNQVIFTNQSGMLSSTQTMEADRVKVLQFSYPSRFASILNYGTIHLYSGGDEKHEVAATMNMFYVRCPEETVESIETILQKKK